MSYILSLDAGTSSSRALIVNAESNIIGISQYPFTQHYPNKDWIEHDPMEIWETQLKVIEEVIDKTGISPEEIAAIGITNQRETTVVWDKATGKPIWNAIVWGDRRTQDRCDKLKPKWEATIQKKTGLFIESYFSATKIQWILDNVSGARARAEKGELLFGTINTWLLWNLTKGKVHTTDISNASRTLLYNIHKQEWDDELIELFNIPKSLLPTVKSCSEIYGETNIDPLPTPVPIAGMAGDQQASLFGNACFTSGEMKVTYGTGCFLMMHTGRRVVESEHKLISTVAWKLGKEKTEYALEGLVYSAGAVVNWLRDSLGMIKSAREIEGLASSVPDSGGIYFVPALSGLASPYWNAHVRGTILGMSPSTNIGHIMRATLEGIAFQVADVVDAMQKDALQTITSIKSDGGMTENGFLQQIQANLLNIALARAAKMEMTALGAAYFAGLAVGFWKGRDEIKTFWTSNTTFKPDLKAADRKAMSKSWKHAIKSAELWAKHQNQ